MGFFNPQSEKCDFRFASFCKHIQRVCKMAARPCAARRLFFNSLLDGAALVGTVSLKIHDMDSRMHLTPWLAALYVAEERRRQGIGTALVRAIERRAAALGIGRLFLYTPASERFYANLGWAVRERTGYHGHAVSVMEKEISP
jgi:GNAT superfamily N-acetyltransferase